MNSNMRHRAFEVLRQDGILQLVHKSMVKIKPWITDNRMWLPYALQKVRKSKAHSTDELVYFCLNDVKGIIKPAQEKVEITLLLNEIAKIKPKVIIEIGTQKGGTLFLFCQVAADDAEIISIDLPHDWRWLGYPLWRKPLYQSFKSLHQKMFLIKADSHNEDTLQQVIKILNGKKVDFLFIDGDHSYEGVKQDFEKFSPLVREGGLIAFHDIVKCPPITKCEVDKFWKEIKNKYKYVEYVKDWEQGYMGIGVLYV